jgi:hypothetical protein
MIEHGVKGKQWAFGKVTDLFALLLLISQSWKCAGWAGYQFQDLVLGL